METLSKYTAILILAFLVSGCISMKLKKLSATYTHIPETQKTLDIPRYNTNHPLNGYPFMYWHFCKQKEKQLSMESPETSNDSLLFRLWITNPVGRKNQPHGMLQIKQDSSKWSADLYLMYVNFSVNDLSETITKYEKIELTPAKNDFKFIVDSLYQLKFDELPTDEAIPGYYKRNEAYTNNLPTFSFEYSTDSIYRFYQYNNFDEKRIEFWQANHVYLILDLLEDEFGWNTLGHDYFRKN